MITDIFANTNAGKGTGSYVNEGSTEICLYAASVIPILKCDKITMY